MRLSRILSTVVVLLLASAPAMAQTHPCDTTVPNVQTIQSGAPHADQFCANPADNLEAFTRYFNDQPSDLLPLTQVSGPNAAGLALFEGPRTVQLPSGTYVYQVSVWNRSTFTGAAQESPRSDPLSLSVVDDRLPPQKPVSRGIAR